MAEKIFPYELPKNWHWTTLEKIAEIIMGQSPRGNDTTNDSAYTPLIGGAADMGKLFPKITRYTKKPTKLSKPNDIIICVRATLGNPIFSDKEYCLGRGVAAIRLFSDSEKFLRYILINFERYFFDNANGSTFKQISSEKIKKFLIPLPPIDEQKKIVARLESLFSKLDSAKEKVQTVLDGYELRRSAILHKAFTGELSKKFRAENNLSLDDWQEKTLKDVCKKFIYGTSKKSKSTGEIIVVRMGNLQNGEIIWENLAYSDDEADIKKYKLSAGDVLFNRTNSAELVGKTSIYRGEYPAIYAGYLIKLDYDKDFLDGEYLNFVLNSPEAKKYCDSVKTNAVNQSNINAKKIGNFKIPLPSLAEQKEIVLVLDSLLVKEQRTKEIAENILQEIDLLKKSILARAFRGEL